MSRGIDHLVLAVHDLDDASGFYERLGFSLTPRAQHPFGTGNRLVQLDGEFLEILSVTRPGDVIPHQQGHFSFGAFNQDYLKCREGMSMIALKSGGWEEDRRVFSDAGLELSAPFTFSRLARQPDGRDVTVGFDLTFILRNDMPEAVFFTCDHQHEPQFFYKPEFQSHANTAKSIDEVFVVATDTGDCSDFIGKLYGKEENTGKQPSLSILTENDLRDRFPNHKTAPLSGSAVFAGYRIRVSSLASVRVILAGNDILCFEKQGSLWLSAFGLIIEFSDQPTGSTSS